jgi:small GTP-binding protein
LSKQPFYEFKVLLVGEPAVGKTSLIFRFVEDKFEREYKPSIGVDLASKTLEIDDKVARLVIWDIASQEQFAPYRSSFYQQANGALMVFDLSRSDTLQAIENWKREVNQYIGNIELVLIGNKSDLKSKRSVRNSDVQPWIDRYGCEYVETSAKNGDKVEDAFRAICTSIISKIKQ